MNDYVLFNEECREKLINGVNLAAQVVKTTLGPKATNCVISSPSGIHITKDGATCLNSVTSADPYEQIGIELMRKLSTRTADNVGDGSTSCVVLASEIINTYKKETDPVKLTRMLQAEVPQIIKYLDSIKEAVTNYDELLKIASLSANNDKELGKLIADAFDKVGKDGVVTYEASDDVINTIEVSTGFKVKNGYTSAGFVNTPSGECVLENVLVYISDTKIEGTKESLIPIADRAMREGKSLLLIAPEYDNLVNVFLKSNLELLKSCAIISPEHRNFREVTIKDLRALLGESSTCKKVIVSNTHTTFIGYDSNQELVNKYIEEAKAIVQDGSRSAVEIDFNKTRIANFTTGHACIKIGGCSEQEIKEKLDRVEDAVRATQAAMNGGYLPGACLALLYGIHDLEKANTDSTVLLADPIEKYAEVLYHTTPKLTGNPWYGEDLKTGQTGNLIDAGVIEPYLVTKEVLENAVSTASMILTCNCAIIHF